MPDPRRRRCCCARKGNSPAGTAARRAGIEMPVTEKGESTKNLSVPAGSFIRKYRTASSFIKGCKGSHLAPRLTPRRSRPRTKAPLSAHGGLPAACAQKRLFPARLCGAVPLFSAHAAGQKKRNARRGSGVSVSVAGAGAACMGRVDIISPVLFRWSWYRRCRLSSRCSRPVRGWSSGRRLSSRCR